MKKKFEINGNEYLIENIKKSTDFIEFSLNGSDVKILKNSLDGKVNYVDDEIWVRTKKKTHYVKELKNNAVKNSDKGGLLSPMPGKVFKILCHQGEYVEKGATLAIIEAMKMEHPIKATSSGKVKEIHFNEGELIKTGAKVVSMEDE